jgi:hypothetical protein
VASLIKNYNLIYFAVDSTIEIVNMIVNLQYDIKNKKTFLKKYPYPSVAPKDLFIGSVLSIFSR